MIWDIGVWGCKSGILSGEFSSGGGSAPFWFFRGARLRWRCARLGAEISRRDFV